MTKYAVSEESLNSILNYLASRPFAEVYKIVPLLQVPNVELLAQEAQAEASEVSEVLDSQESAS